MFLFSCQIAREGYAATPAIRFDAIISFCVRGDNGVIDAVHSVCVCSNCSPGSRQSGGGINVRLRWWRADFHRLFRFLQHQRCANRCAEGLNLPSLVGDTLLRITERATMIAITTRVSTGTLLTPVLACRKQIECPDLPNGTRRRCIPLQ